MNKLAVSFCICLFGFICLAQNELFFEKEDITFDLRDSLFFVRGLYYFNSQSENEFLLLYPFPKDSIFGKPFDIQIAYFNLNKVISYELAKDSSSVVFRIVADSLQPIWISYCQQLKSNTARYILNTTNNWQRPLKQVDYKLVTGLDLSIKRFSIEPDKVIQVDNKNIYLWHKENFMPRNDFIIEF